MLVDFDEVDLIELVELPEGQLGLQDVAEDQLVAALVLEALEAEVNNLVASDFLLDLPQI